MVGLALAGGCLERASDQDSTPTDNPALGEMVQRNELELTSPAFGEGESIPDKYGKANENVNPPLSISGVPEASQSLTLIMDDPDAPNGTFTHWLVWNVPPDIGEIREDWNPPERVIQGENDFGTTGYEGPQPPNEHTYRFKLYALEGTLDLESSTSKRALGEAMVGQILAQTQLTGTFAP